MEVKSVYAVVLGDEIQFAGEDYKEVDSFYKEFEESYMSITTGFEKGYAILDSQGDLVCTTLFQDQDDARDFLENVF